jgi:CO dehydrogenase maturation factor
MVILDMEAGVEHLGRKTAEAVDIMIIVVEPGLKSLETAERIKRLANDIGIEKIVCVVNKVSSPEEEEFVKEKLQELKVEIIGTIPRDAVVVKADMEGKALVDYQSSEALLSIKEIADKILEEDSIG